MSSTTARGTASTRRAAAPAAGRQARRTAPAAEPAAIVEERAWEKRVGVGEVDGGSARPLGSRRGGVRKEGPKRRAPARWPGQTPAQAASGLG
jgi:hypothetical protein